MKTKPLSLIFIAVMTIFNAICFTTEAQNTKPFVVVLDAGHGGHDSGKYSNGFKESDIALKIVKQIGEKLSKHKNLKIIYTRTSDVFITLKGRADIANKAEADLFVSVHCNAHHTQASGAETYVLGSSRNKTNLEVAKAENEVIFLEDNYKETYAGFDPNNPESFIGLTIMQEEYLDQSIMLAGLVQNNFTNNLKRKNRDVKQAGFVVLFQTYMPSILIETGFITNTQERKYLASSKGQNELSTEITNAINTYVNNLALGTSGAQNPIITEQEIEEAIKISEEDIYKGVEFKVQLAASKRKLETKPQNFKGLKDVDRDKEGDLYKYYYGNTSDYTKIQLMKTYAQEKGYSSAFVIAYKGGKKVKLSEVLSTKDK